MIKQQKTYFLYLLLALIGCSKENPRYRPVATLYLTVVDDTKALVNGAELYIFDNEIDYEQAFTTKNYSRAIVITQQALGNGRYSVELEPNKEFWLLIRYFDNGRQLNLTNYGTSGYIKKLDQRTDVYVEAIISPYSGNLIFYSSANNNVPIEIKISQFATQAGLSVHTLTGIYTGTGTPTVLSANVLQIARDPGSYSYYAKSTDGCVWSGKIKLEKGQALPIDLPKCDNGAVYFYTTAVNTNLLPLRVRLNYFNNSQAVIQDVGTISGVRTSLSCTDADKSNSVLSYQPAGKYTYYVESANSNCVWTGEFDLPANGCMTIPLSDCER